MRIKKRRKKIGKEKGEEKSRRKKITGKKACRNRENKKTVPEE